MSIRIEKSTQSRISQCLRPRSMIGVPAIIRKPRKIFLKNPSLKDQGFVIPGAVKQYPYQTHLKRFPVYDALNFSYFAKHSQKPFEVRNLYETMHSLPFRGVGFHFWRDSKGLRNWNRDKAVKTFSDYIPPVQKTFVPRVVAFKHRPWRAKVHGHMFINGNAARASVTPLAFDRGHWCWRLPEFSDSLPSKFRPILPESSLFGAPEVPKLEDRLPRIKKRTRL